MTCQAENGIGAGQAGLSSESQHPHPQKDSSHDWAFALNGSG